MMVSPNGDISGTIGSGAVEGDAIQRTLGLIETGGAEIIDYDLNRGATTDGMDLICGEQIQVLINIEGKGHSYVIEPIRPLHTVFLFGAGLLSTNIATPCEMVGFCIIVFGNGAERVLIKVHVAQLIQHRAKRLNHEYG